jgi:hypothetical protein
MDSAEDRASVSRQWKEKRGIGRDAKSRAGMSPLGYWLPEFSLKSRYRVRGLSGSRGVQNLNVIQQNFLVALGVYLFVYLPNYALRVDHERRSFPEFHFLPFGLPQSERLHQLRVCVGQQIDGERELGAKLFVRTNLIGADPDNIDACRIEIGFACGKRLPLDGATRGVVFGIEIHDEPMARVIPELGDLAVLIRKRKIWEGTACLHHEIDLFPFTEMLKL